MKYVWIEESPNTASDCGVAPPKKGDGLRSWRGTTRKVEEHFPRHVQGLGWRKSSRSFAEKTVWRADGDKNPQKRYVQGSDGRTRDVGRLVGIRRSWRRRRVAGKGLTRRRVRFSRRPRSSWCGQCRKKMSPEKFAGKFAAAECFLTTIRLTGKFWEMGKVTGMKHGHRPGIDDTGKLERISYLINEDILVEISFSTSSVGQVPGLLGLLAKVILKIVLLAAVLQILFGDFDGTYILYWVLYSPGQFSLLGHQQFIICHSGAGILRLF
ncbi:hypothetical protein CK203_022572 [Vitis vinifera]|uniref:Uncharacterized protein n=1 Tax=Vitis vinifera TaxID=29760 RepID=A0A438JEQ8_VITVI|nr:hypothetical protein CK203_022572 [Vitis vinifera]